MVEKMDTIKRNPLVLVAIVLLASGIALTIIATIINKPTDGTDFHGELMSRSEEKAAFSVASKLITIGIVLPPDDAKKETSNLLASDATVDLSDLHVSNNSNSATVTNISWLISEDKSSPSYVILVSVYTYGDNGFTDRSYEVTVTKEDGNWKVKNVSKTPVAYYMDYKIEDRIIS